MCVYIIQHHINGIGYIYRRFWFVVMDVLGMY